MKLGWILSNNENDDVVIQKDDDMARFKSDDAATEFVVKSYAELLEALRCAVIDAGINMTLKERKQRAEFYIKAINNAQGLNETCPDCGQTLDEGKCDNPSCIVNFEEE
jgi:hypothetical protein